MESHSRPHPLFWLILLATIAGQPILQVYAQPSPAAPGHLDPATSISPLPSATERLPVNSIVLYYENFDDPALPGWSTSGDVQWDDGLYTLNGAAASLSGYAWLSHTIATFGYRELTLQVSLLGLGLVRNEHLRAEIQNPNGRWEVLAVLNASQDDGYYRYHQITLPAWTEGELELELRFRLMALHPSDQGYVDEIYLHGQPFEAQQTDPSSDCPACVADFALYDPYYENDGVWEEEVIALRAMLDSFGWTYQLIDHDDLNAGILGAGSERRYRGLLAPGGYAYYRNLALTPEGEAAVRTFLEEGGNYVGFCAGSFWASADVVWAEEASGGSGSYNLANDYQTYAYQLELFPGAAQGPLGWTPWDAGTNASLQPVAVDLTVPTMSTIGIPAETRFFYYGGPFFVGTESLPPGTEVWARAVPPSDLPEEALTGAGEPMIIRYARGAGQVILFSHHPEVLINDVTDQLVLSTYFDEADLFWDTGDQTWDEINLQSWNIVHAALQIAANEAVTPLTELP